MPADGVALNLDRADDFHDVFERRFNEEEQPEDAASASDAQEEWARARRAGGRAGGAGASCSCGWASGVRSGAPETHDHREKLFHDLPWERHAVNKSRPKEAHANASTTIPVPNTVRAPTASITDAINFPGSWITLFRILEDRARMGHSEEGQA